MKHKKAYRPKPTSKGKHFYGGNKRNGGNRTDRGKPQGKKGKR